jgi:hypothetical protein
MTDRHKAAMKIYPGLKRLLGVQDIKKRDTGPDIQKLEPADDATRKKLVHLAIKKAHRSPEFQQTGRGAMDVTAQADRDGLAQETPEKRIARLTTERDRLKRLISTAGPDTDTPAMSARIAALDTQIAIETALQKPQVSMR